MTPPREGGRAPGRSPRHVPLVKRDVQRLPTYEVPATPIDETRLALRLCRMHGCSTYNDRRRTKCRRCGTTL